MEFKIVMWEVGDFANFHRVTYECRDNVVHLIWCKLVVH